MASLDYIIDCVIPAALCVLPDAMESDQARAMLVAIGLQESRFQHRRQIRGPARGFWQFEEAGINGVLAHSATRSQIRGILLMMGYEPSQAYEAVEHNDILACVFARLLLWTLPDPLPEEAGPAWTQYLAAWHPGRPNRESWDDLYAQAWESI